MNSPDPMQDLSMWAEILVLRLESMVHEDVDVFDQTTYNVLAAAALEVSELEHLLLSGCADRTWWATVKGGPE